MMQYPTTLLEGRVLLHFLAYDTEDEIWKDKLRGVYYLYNTETKLWTNRDTREVFIGYSDTYHKGLK